MKKLTIAALIMITALNLFSSEKVDSAQFFGVFTVQGMYQSGNLNQISTNGFSSLSFQKKDWKAQLNSNYTFVKVEDHVIVNDLWNNLQLDYKVHKVIFPSSMTYYGLGKSFGITTAFLSGVGPGWNIIPAKPNRFLKLVILGAYSRFSYENVEDLEGFATNAHVSARASLFNEKVNLNWTFHGFLMPEANFVIKSQGAQNRISFEFPLRKKVNLTATHQWLYNSYVDTNVATHNTQILVGLSYRSL